MKSCPLDFEGATFRNLLCVRRLSATALSPETYLCAMVRELLDLLMPRGCLVCGRILGAREHYLCIHCAADLPLTYYWEYVHNPMANEFNALLERFRGPGEAMAYVPAAALLFYHHENPYKHIPKALKYGGDLPAGRYFATRLGRYLASYQAFADVDVVIPVPLHWWRRYRRGYNQAQVIAAALARELGATLRTDILFRIRRTGTQTRLDAEARLSNVRGVFRVRKRLTAKHILLVDDTFTTGATLSACYFALRAALGPEVRFSIATLSVVQS